MAGERTEAPTPKRRDDARRDGNVAKSQDLVSAGVLLAVVIAFRVVGPGLWSDMSGIVRDGLQSPGHAELTPEAAMGIGRDTAARTLLALAPLFAVAALAGIVFNVGQTGLMFSGAGAKPRFSHLNPGSGVKRIFSQRGGVEFLKAIAKMAITAVAVYVTLRGQLAEISGLGQVSLVTAGGRLAALSFDVALRAASVLFLLAVLDWAWQRRQYMTRLRMTKEEVRQEMKESDGDPQVKQAIRRRRQALMNRMMASVPSADVVVTNPTHYAVAIKYDPVSMAAPMVVAKGESLLAQRIKDVARKAGVPVLEEPPLARALYAAVPVGQFVPGNLFHAVAEVLAWVYALRNRGGAMRPQRRPQGAS